MGCGLNPEPSHFITVLAFFLWFSIFLCRLLSRGSRFVVFDCFPFSASLPLSLSGSLNGFQDPDRFSVRGSGSHPEMSGALRVCPWAAGKLGSRSERFLPPALTGLSFLRTLSSGAGHGSHSSWPHLQAWKLRLPAQPPASRGRSPSPHHQTGTSSRLPRLVALCSACFWPTKISFFLLSLCLQWNGVSKVWTQQYLYQGYSDIFLLK